MDKMFFSRHIAQNITEIWCRPNKTKIAVLIVPTDDGLANQYVNVVVDAFKKAMNIQH